MNYKYRMHDTRLGRFFAVDPLEADYPHNSPYAFSENQVIDAIELEGLEKWEIHQQEISQVIYPGTSNYEFTSNIVETTITEQSGTLYGPYLNQEIVDDVFLSDKSKVENYQSKTTPYIAFNISYGQSGAAQSTSVFGTLMDIFVREGIDEGLQGLGVSEEASYYTSSAMTVFGSLFLASKVSFSGAPKSEFAAKGGLAEARALGVAGEQAVGVGSKTRIPSLTGTAKYRIPDQLTSTTLGEVKNVSHLSLTRQLTDFHLYSQQNGLQFILHTRPTTTFSGPLQNLINNGSIIVKPIPFR